MTRSTSRRGTVLLLLAAAHALAPPAAVGQDTGEARSRNDLTFVTGLNVSF